LGTALMSLQVEDVILCLWAVVIIGEVTYGHGFEWIDGIGLMGRAAVVFWEARVSCGFVNGDCGERSTVVCGLLELMVVRQR
jgi:hypothetical protein